MRCLSSEFGIRIAIEARVECDDALITGKSQLIGGRAERGARDEGWGDVGVWYDDNWRHKPESIMETMPHCCRCPGRKQSLLICSNSNSKFNSDFDSDSDSHCESNCDYPQSLSQSTVLRYYCCYFCPCSPCCCCCCYPCYPCCCPVADCAAIVFKNEIKMVLAIADSLEWWRRTDRGWGRGGSEASLGHTSSCLSPPALLFCALFWATKAVKIADYNRGFPSHNCLLLLQLFPPVRFALLSLCFSLLCSSLLFSLDTFTLPFGHLSPPSAPLSPAQWPPQWHGTRRRFHFLLVFHFILLLLLVLLLVLFLLLVFISIPHERKHLYLCAPFACPSPSPPFPSSHLLPRLPPLCLPQWFFLPLPLPLPLPLFLCRICCGLFIFICCPLAPSLRFYFVLICVFVCFVLSVSLCFLFSTPSPRDSQIC